MNLIGTWSLESFEIENDEHGRKDWGSNVRGLLLYSSTGHMSVAINRDAALDGSVEKQIIDSILFYAGTYSTDGSTIHHKVTLASNPARIGKDMIRFANFDGDLLTLTTPKESYGVARLIWRKQK